MFIPDEFKKGIIYIGLEISGIFRPFGTGFLATLPTPRPEEVTPFFVTARHVVENAYHYAERIGVSNEGLAIRANRLDGSVAIEKTPFGEWKFHATDESIDIAVLLGSLNRQTYDYLTATEQLFITQNDIDSGLIGIGDEVFTVGLYIRHFGNNKNLPIVRIGNIASIPDEPIRFQNIEAESYLIESRSTGGLSGSPVFVIINSRRRGEINLGQEQIRFLGIVRGHWETAPRSRHDTDNSDMIESVNEGIAIVVPAKKVWEAMTLERNRRFGPPA